MKKGFTLLISILVSAVLLSIALGIFNLTTRQLELSTTAKNSQLALFAADSGIECAMYWDLQQSEFPFAVPGQSFYTYPYSPMSCGDTPAITMDDTDNLQTDTSGDPTIATTSIDFYVGTSYVHVEIVKYNYVAGSLTGDQGTAIYSYGYNSGPNEADPSRIERALRETYGYGVPTSD